MNIPNIELSNLLKERDFSKLYSFYAVVSTVRKNVDKTGNFYLNLQLNTQNVSIEGKKWNFNDHIDGKVFVSGKLLLVNGRITTFRNQDQFVIENAEVINDPQLLERLLPKPPVELVALKSELLAFFEKITDLDYQKIIKTIFTEETLTNFLQVRAGLRIHHNVYGGLSWHTVSILKVAEAILPVYSYLPVNRSLLYAGIILHDFGKIVEIGAYSEDTYSFSGKLLGHIVIASQIIGQVGEKLAISKEKIELLQHLVLSSHGKLENGSPREPVLIEAFLLSQLDNLDAKMGIIFNNFKNIELNKFTPSFVLNSDNFVKRVSFFHHFFPEE